MPCSERSSMIFTGSPSRAAPHSTVNHLARAAGAVLGRMAFLDVPGLIHRRKNEVIDVRPLFAVDAARVGVDDPVIERLWIDLAVVPRRRRGRAVQPFEMVLVDGVLDHLKKIAMDEPPRSEERRVGK